mgnify:CR=1 FL=1
MENKVINLIIDFVNGAYETTKDGFYEIRDGKHAIFGCRYLLNQIIREYELPNDHYLVSEGALAEWKRLGLEKENINKYYYHEIIKLNGVYKYYRYKGADKTPTLEESDWFRFNDIFHLEHIVPIKMIIKRLFELKKNNQLTQENVADTLDKIYICRMLKREDRNIKAKYNRGTLNYKEIVNTIYKEAGIVVKDN